MRRQELLLGLLLASLTGCSGTRFGDALSGSFSTPAPATPPTGAGTAAATVPGASSTAPPGTAPLPPSARRNTSTGGASGPATPPQASPAPSSAGASSTGSTPGSSGTSTAQPTAPRPATGASPPRGTTAAVAPSSPPRPAPYRVTILLPQADAAAPAEVVTQALRAAGVPFEVETIERLGRTTPSQPPASRPAPEPR
ncbi:MAG: hypothetical protein ACKOXO_08450 [Cyanobium sp.]